MLFEDALTRYFDDLTTSMRITITSADVHLQRRHDGAMESLARLANQEKASFVESLSQRVGCKQDRGVFTAPDRAQTTFQFMNLPVAGAQIFVIKRVQDAGIRPLTEMGFSADEAERMRQMLRPTEGVVVVSCPWCGSLPREVASVLHAGWASDRETGVNIGDFIHWHVPGFAEVRIDSTDRPGLSRVVNTVRNMELLPVVLALSNEEVALQEAFRLAQMDYLVYVVCDSRNVIDTVAWLRQRVDHWVLSEYLSGIISMRPLRSICPHCTQPDTSPDETLLLKVGLAPSQAGRLMRGAGCPACEGSGTGAMMVAWEMLSLYHDEPLPSMMKDGTTESERIEAIKRSRGLTIEERARTLLLSGRASLHEVEHGVFRPRFKT